MVSLLVLIMFRIVTIVFIAFWIWALVDCLLRPEDSYEKMFGTISPKLVWALIIFFGNLIGAIIYLFVAGTRKNPRQTVVAADSAETEEGKRILRMVADGKISPEEGQRLLVALGKKEIEKAKSQSTAGPMSLKIGLVLLLVFLIPFFIAVLLPVFSGAWKTHEKQMQAQSNELIKAVRELENMKK